MLQTEVELRRALRNLLHSQRQRQLGRVQGAQSKAPDVNPQLRLLASCISSDGQGDAPAHRSRLTACRGGRLRRACVVDDGRGFEVLLEPLFQVQGTRPELSFNEILKGNVFKMF